MLPSSIILLPANSEPVTGWPCSACGLDANEASPLDDSEADSGPLSQRGEQQARLHLVQGEDHAVTAWLRPPAPVVPRPVPSALSPSGVHLRVALERIEVLEARSRELDAEVARGAIRRAEALAIADRSQATARTAVDTLATMRSIAQRKHEQFVGAKADLAEARAHALALDAELRATRKEVLDAREAQYRAEARTAEILARIDELRSRL